MGRIWGGGNRVENVEWGRVLPVLIVLLVLVVPVVPLCRSRGMSRVENVEWGSPVKVNATILWVWGDRWHLLLPIGHLLLPKTARWMPNRPGKRAPKGLFGNASPGQEQMFVFRNKQMLLLRWTPIRLPSADGLCKVEAYLVVTVFLPRSVSILTYGRTFCSRPRSFGLRTISFAGIFRMLKRSATSGPNFLVNRSYGVLSSRTGRT